MVSKSKIEKKLLKKENPSLRKEIIMLKKSDHAFWIKVGNLLASPKRQKVSVNIEKINRFTENNDKVIVPGKVLSDGELSHEITLAAFSMSKNAKEKLGKAKIRTIGQMIKENPDGKGIKLII